MKRKHIECGDALTFLRGLPDESVHCIVTSPPYWNLRDYGVADQLGSEPTPHEYVDALVAVFREARRVLRSDGTLWLNLGDSYANDTKWGGKTGGKHATGLHGTTAIGRNRTNTGLPSKSLIGIPWRVAFGLQDDGWILRSDIIWHKEVILPESVTDRPTKCHEYIFLFTKCPTYWYDHHAVKEPAGDWGERDRSNGKYTSGDVPIPGGAHGGLKGTSKQDEPLTRNKRSVWTVNPEPFSGAHFATFPTKLIEPCILAGCPAAACAACHTPYKRITERTGMPSQHRPQGRRALELFERAGLTEAHISAMRAVGMADAGKALVTMSGAGKNTEEVQRLASEAKTVLGGYYREFLFGGSRTVGFAPTCACDAETRPGITLDPFMGSGTTAFVARYHGRDYLGSELNPKYVEIALERLRLPFEPRVARHDNDLSDLPMFAPQMTYDEELT